MRARNCGEGTCEVYDVHTGSCANQNPVRRGGHDLQIAGFWVRRFSDGSYFLQRAEGVDEGEGTQVSESDVAKALNDLYTRVF